ncbi:Aurora/IPL1-related protein kinase 2 [Colletotrichum siamense]|uniref:Aurora/IPL1-related protein kinase 2 n=1 Tax=Colletotrichum siamense TaxID=690259 RepID=UPI00187320FA|nr:Aurora/IPL1-related protein kinase 2 [Colletotrichum siamense]KAF5506317.1 Aurora/IPL1-related protein kinase 2 [Colletotrichum siamense]
MAPSSPKAVSRGRPTETLSDRILGTFISSAFDSQHRFLSQGSMEELVTKESILNTFLRGRQWRNEGPKLISDEQLADYILKHARTIFAIAVMLALPGSELREGMRQGQEREMSDQHLPIDTTYWSGEHVNSDGTSSFIEDYEDEIWSPARIDLFCRAQWQFLAPVFSISKLNHDLSPHCVLPFTDKIQECRMGAFGQVSGYAIHPSHLVDSNDKDFHCPKYVAVKRINDEEADRQKMVHSWEREADILQKMNQLNQPHIVRFLTAFRRGSPGQEEHFLMMEWANGGNLRDFWRKFDRPTLTGDLTKATLRQILGLAEAISKAHYPVSTSGLNFRHGDLKPENILWFKDGGDVDGIGLLKIGDWGLAKQHRFVTELRSNKTTTRWGTRAYEPPEEAASQGAKLLVPGQSGKKRSRLYDIWAMGCITLEFWIWLVYGLEQLEEFTARIYLSNPDAPRFYQVKRDSSNQLIATVHDVAVRWMEHMAKDPIFKVGQTALGNLLEVVQTRLLVVKLPERLGTSAITSDDTMAPQQDVVREPIVNRSADSPANATEAQHVVALDIALEPPDIVVSGPGAKETGQKQEVDPGTNRAFSKGGRERARSNQFYDSMLEIEGEDEDDSYW